MSRIAESGKAKRLEFNCGSLSGSLALYKGTLIDQSQRTQNKNNNNQMVRSSFMLIAALTTLQAFGLDLGVRQTPV